MYLTQFFVFNTLILMKINLSSAIILEIRKFGYLWNRKLEGIPDLL